MAALPSIRVVVVLFAENAEDRAESAFDVAAPILKFSETIVAGCYGCESSPSFAPFRGGPQPRTVAAVAGRFSLPVLV
jgi:hypothetical protein